MEISNAEFEVMKVLWKRSPLSSQEIVDGIDPQNNWHEKTVKTLINRLVKKGAICFEKENRRYLYSPLVERNQYQFKESESLLAKLFGGRLTPLVASFAKQDKLEREDVEELKKLIDDWEQSNER